MSYRASEMTIYVWPYNSIAHALELARVAGIPHPTAAGAPEPTGKLSPGNGNLETIWLELHLYHLIYTSTRSLDLVRYIIISDQTRLSGRSYCRSPFGPCFGFLLAFLSNVEASVFR